MDGFRSRVKTVQRGMAWHGPQDERFKRSASCWESVERVKHTKVEVNVERSKRTSQSSPAPPPEWRQQPFDNIKHNRCGQGRHLGRDCQQGSHYHQKRLPEIIHPALNKTAHWPAHAGHRPRWQSRTHSSKLHQAAAASKTIRR